jgi:hypothetical protein
VLHLAASCGHGAVVRWLVRRADAGIDVRDVESGYTGLHRSIFYGQIHVATDLIKVSDTKTMILTLYEQISFLMLKVCIS